MKPKETNSNANNMFNEILAKSSLESRLEVSNQMAFINLLTELGFREDKMWSEDENPMLAKLCKLAEEHTKHQLEQIDEWKADGEPK